MKRALRIGLGILGAPVVLAAAAAAFLASPWSTNIVKAQAVAAMRDSYQRTLRIDGPLEFSFYPRLGVRVAGVSLSEPGGAESFASLEAAHFAVAVEPLFSRRVVVDACEVRGLRASVVRRKDGTLNIDDLLAQPERPAAAPLQIDVPACAVGAAELAWRDELKGGGVTIRNLELKAGGLQADTGAKTVHADRLALDFELRAAAAVVKAGLTTSFAADFGVRSFAWEDLAGRVEIAHPRLVRRLSLPLTGMLRADVARQTAAGRLAARLDDSRLGLNVAVSRFAPPRLTFELDIDRLDVDRYLKPAQEKRPEAGSAPSQAGSLGSLEASGTVRIGSLSVGAVKASKLTLRFAAADGRLDTGALKALGVE